MKEYRILITGSRDWDNVEAMYEKLAAHTTIAFMKGYRIVTIVEGGAPGADSIAQVWADQALRIGFAVSVEPHPADWSKGKSAGPIRNQEMVDTGADVCLAFPMPDSRGTRDCMARAEKAGIPVIVTNYGEK